MDLVAYDNSKVRSAIRVNIREIRGKTKGEMGILRLGTSPNTIKTAVSSYIMESQQPYNGFLQVISSFLRHTPSPDRSFVRYVNLLSKRRGAKCTR
jgi:hypothetical protein